MLCRKASRAEKPVDEEMSEQVMKGHHDREYYCKGGRRLDLACRNKKSGYLSFRMALDFCEGCPLQATCHLFGKKHPEVLDDMDRKIYNDYLSFSRTEEWKESYKRRKVIVEPVFGNIKNKGMRICVRGKRAVLAWWQIATTAHNIEKIIGRLAQPNGSLFSILIESIMSFGRRTAMIIHLSYGR